MTTLFSPVGTADPLTQLGDGPMLHIVRRYRPDKVVLFLSPAMAAHQRADERYTRAIDLLAESLGMRSPEVELVESDFADVHRFDHYIDEFEVVLRRLASEDDAPVLVNVSSGTPGMEQALVALGAFGQLDLKLVQVTTPAAGPNSRNDREDPNDYDLDSLWEWNGEVEDGTVDRTQVVDTPHFADRLLRDNVIALVKGYEYRTAYDLSCQMASVDPAAQEMILAAADRMNLKGGLPSKVFGGTSLAYKANDLLVEYLYTMEVRLAQGHWADFIRSMSPPLLALMLRYLDAACLPENKYAVTGGSKEGMAFYDADKIDADERLASVLYPFHYYESRKRVSNDARLRLLEEYCEDVAAVEKIGRLRRVEEKCRNTLAHYLKPISKEQLEKLGGMPLDDVMKCLYDLHGNAEPGMYDRINDVIVERL